MSLFFNPNKHKSEWASLVLANAPDNVPEKLLKEATSMYISQHSRILYESMKLFLTSKNGGTDI